MPKAIVEEDRDLTPSAAQDLGAAVFFSPVSALGAPGHLGSRAEIEKEIDLIAAAIRIFHMKPPDLVMRECSAYSARLTEMEVLLHRVEGVERQWARIRTMQVAKFLAEIDRQWKTASRLIEVSRQDITLAGGQP